MKGVILDINERALEYPHIVVWSDIVAIDIPSGLDKCCISGVRFNSEEERLWVNKVLSGKIDYKGFETI